LAVHTWQSALAARLYGNEAQEGSSGPFRTVREFARIRQGSVARNYGKIGDLCDKAQHETFQGRDAQLDTAVADLLKRIEEESVAVPHPPSYPNKAMPIPGRVWGSSERVDW